MNVNPFWKLMCTGWLWLALLFSGLAWSQQPAAPTVPPRQSAQAIREAMDQSVRKQRDAVRRQGDTSQTQEPGWFTVPWQEPAARHPENSTSSASMLLPPCEPVPKDSVDPQVQAAAQREGYSADLLHAIIQRESAYFPCATSPKGAQGLMQLMPATAAALGVNNPLDPAENINGGAKYLRQLLSRYGGDLKLALAAYNAGPKRVDEVGAIPSIPETRNYVNEILKKIAPLPEQ